MKSLDNENKLSIFNSVKRMLENKTIPVNDTAMKPIQQAGDYFENAVETMYSIIEKDKPYDFSVDNIKKMLEFNGYSFKEYASQQKEELELAIKDFKKYRLRLSELEDEPKRFFSDESRVREIYKICNKMKNFYLRLVDEENFRESQD
jgi:hypothetical protein